MKQWIAVLVVAAVGLIAPVAAQAQLSVGQLVTQLRPADGSAVVEIEVRNDGAAAVDVEVAINDWRVDEDGTHRFLPAGTVEGSCGHRMQVADGTLRIAAGGTTRVSVSYDGAARDRCRNIVFFRVTERPDVLGGDRLIISTGVKVYVEP